MDYSTLPAGWPIKHTIDCTNLAAEFDRTYYEELRKLAMEYEIAIITGTQTREITPTKFEAIYDFVDTTYWEKEFGEPIPPDMPLSHARRPDLMMTKRTTEMFPDMDFPIPDDTADKHQLIDYLHNRIIGGDSRNILLVADNLEIVRMLRKEFFQRLATTGASLKWYKKEMEVIRLDGGQTIRFEDRYQKNVPERNPNIDTLATFRLSRNQCRTLKKLFPVAFHVQFQRQKLIDPKTKTFK